MRQFIVSVILVILALKPNAQSVDTTSFSKSLEWKRYNSGKALENTGKVMMGLSIAAGMYVLIKYSADFGSAFNTFGNNTSYKTTDAIAVVSGVLGYGGLILYFIGRSEKKKSGWQVTHSSHMIIPGSRLSVTSLGVAIPF